MGNQDPSGAGNRLVKVLRKITRVVQVAPFVYLLLLSLYLLTESALPGWAVRFADNLLNAPLFAIAGMLGIGKLLKLCSWFRTACLLPITTKLEGWIDSFVITFTQEEVIIINASLGILFLIYIYLANRHFFHVRKAHTI